MSVELMGWMQRYEKTMMGDISFIGIGDKRRGCRTSPPAEISRLLGSKEEMGWISPASSSANTCCYIREVFEDALEDAPDCSNPKFTKIEKVLK